MNDRAASEIIGFVLAVGITIALLALLQVAAAPAWNANVEADHTQQLQADMVGFHSDVVSTSTDGGTRSAPVTLGARYGGGGVFLRPPPATGQLESTPGAIKIQNLDVESADRADNPEQAIFGDWETETRLLTYRPNYSERDGPTTHYEHTTLFEDHGDDELVRAGSVVDGRTIRLVTLSGDVQQASASRVNIALAEESTSTRSIPVNAPEGETATITLSTTRSPEFWQERLAGNSNVAVDDAESVAGESVTLRLEHLPDRNYRLQLSSVHLGDGEPAQQEVAYVFVRDTEVARGEAATVEPRDQFGNPVPNTDLAPFLTHTCDREPRSTRTGTDGQLRLSCPHGSAEFTFFEGQPQQDHIRVFGVDEVASQPPEIQDASADSTFVRYQTVPQGGDGTIPQTQIRVTYAVQEMIPPGSELDRVEIRLYDLRDGIERLSATTHSFRGATPDENDVHDGRWTTPWLTGEFETLGQDYRVEIVAVNAEGLESDCIRIGEASNCD